MKNNQGWDENNASFNIHYLLAYVQVESTPEMSNMIHHLPSLFLDFCPIWVSETSTSDLTTQCPLILHVVHTKCRAHDTTLQVSPLRVDSSSRACRPPSRLRSNAARAHQLGHPPPPPRETPAPSSALPPPFPERSARRAHAARLRTCRSWSEIGVLLSTWGHCPNLARLTTSLHVGPFFRSWPASSLHALNRVQRSRGREEEG